MKDIYITRNNKTLKTKNKIFSEMDFQIILDDFFEEYDDFVFNTYVQDSPPHGTLESKVICKYLKYVYLLDKVVASKLVLSFKQRIITGRKQFYVTNDPQSQRHERLYLIQDAKGLPYNLHIINNDKKNIYITNTRYGKRLTKEGKSLLSIHGKIPVLNNGKKLRVNVGLRKRGVKLLKEDKAKNIFKAQSRIKKSKYIDIKELQGVII